MRRAAAAQREPEAILVGLLLGLFAALAWAGLA